MSNTLSNLLHRKDELLRQVFQPWRLPAGLGHHGPPPLRQAQLSLAQPAETGHRGQVQLTQKREGKTVTQTLSSPAAMRKAGKEIAAFRRFQALTHDLVEVNQKICRLRLIEGQEQTASRKKRCKGSSRKSSAN